MTKRMLIDATHPEETRVVVLNGNRLEEYDFETSTKKQLKGNIYLAKVTRVEPSLQACFVEFGGGRHGFLAFNEIHPDYWRIPIADREALLAEERRLAEREDRDDRDDRDEREDRRYRREPPPVADEPPPASAAPLSEPAELVPEVAPQPSFAEPPPATAPQSEPSQAQPLAFDVPRITDPVPVEPPLAFPLPAVEPGAGEVPPPLAGPLDSTPDATVGEPPAAEPSVTDATEPAAAPPVPVESVGGNELDEQEEEQEERRRRFKPLRHYKIQEVIKRRQVLLVQVVKEERGTKGAALTTYLSLAGRYCVLMPNTTRGGGISRRITSAQDRKRLKEIMRELDVPDGMAVILRTAGMERSIQEIRRDYEHLMRLWDDVRELTLGSTAPALVYEEGSLIKRAMRDIYSRDVDEILVEGRDGFEQARAFLGGLMPGHAEKIRLYDDPAVPLFQRFQVETQLEEMYEPTVRLRSGGYIVINPTEALVAIDVNSGRATRERDIEGTALRTNVEAAEEIARQLRLRDLAGLIVIDFIDMEEHRHAGQVERRLKEAMHVDRARIQIGRISAFGLLELSRQRLRPSLLEVSTQKCPHCGGSGHIRSTESSALAVLRALEEEGAKQRATELRVSVPESVALYILNHKRAALASIESRHGLRIAFDGDPAMIPPAFKIDRLRARDRAESGPGPVRSDLGAADAAAAAEAESGESAETAAVPEEPFVPPGPPVELRPRASDGGDDDRQGGRRGRRRRRRGRGGREEGGAPGVAAPAPAFAPPAGATPMPGDGPQPDAGFDAAAEVGAAPGAPAPRPDRHDDEDGGRRRRRGRRGGRRRRGGREGGPAAPAPAAGPAAPEPDYAPPPPPSADDDDLRARARALYAAEAPRYPDRASDPQPTQAAAEAHDWPWNRPAESTASGPTPPPASPSAPPPDEPAPPASSAADAETDDPKGPPRKGWWKRLTS